MQKIDNSRDATPSASARAIDANGYSWPTKGTKLRNEESADDRLARLEKIAGAIETILECIGEDPDREGVQKTPMRYAKALMFFTKGYEANLQTILNEALFEENHDEMVIVKNIDIFSLCEHHMVPFVGKVNSATWPPCSCCS